MIESCLERKRYLSHVFDVCSSDGAPFLNSSHFKPPSVPKDVLIGFLTDNVFLENFHTYPSLKTLVVFV